MARKDLDLLTRLAYERERSQAAFNEAIVKAVESGETYRDVAQAGRISHQRVGQIIKAYRLRERPQQE
jgi:Mor family transcriptional regulator